MQDDLSGPERWRLAKGWSKQELVRRTGLARQTVYNVLSLGAGMPETLRRFADVFEITEGRLLLGPEPETVNRSDFTVVPVYELVEAGGLKGSESVSKDYVLREIVTHEDFILYRLTDCNLGGYRAGDAFLIDLRRNRPNAGALVLATVPGRPAEMYRVIRDSGRYLLSKNNPVIPPVKKPWTILGTAVRQERDEENL